MSDYGFFRVAAATPVVKVADPDANASRIIELIDQAEASKAALVVFPELCITGYTCGDLFGQQLLLDSADKAVARIAAYTRGLKTTVVVGTPARIGGRLYNCAAVIRCGEIKGLVPKTFIPGYAEFYENRWFSSGTDFLHKDGTRGSIAPENVSPNMLFKAGKATFAVEICEDLWSPIPPSSWHAVQGAEVIVNLSASNEVIMKHMYRRNLVSGHSSRTISAYVYSSCGYGESTQDLVFGGSSLICENGTFLAENGRFSTSPSIIYADIDIERLQALRQKDNTFHAIAPDGTPSGNYAQCYSLTDLGPAPDTDFEKELMRHVEPHPFVPSGDSAELDRRAREIISMQVLALATRLSHIGCKKAILGISGGLDSTLALLVTVLAFDKLGLPRDGVIGITMPGFGTTGRTHGNACGLMEALGITSREIPIGPSVSRHFQDIGQDPEKHDVTYENSQARERTQILMDIANMENGIVVGTGDLSELALGWATYNGDHMSMYGVNASIPKTLVKHLVKWAAVNHFSSTDSSGKSIKDILLDIADTPISPELTPADEDGNIAQKTEDIVGPYELHDFFLFNFFRFGYSPSKILFLARKAFEGEFTTAEISRWLDVFIRRFFSQQFKRSCMPDGPKVGTVSLSPRGDWRMPSDVSSTLFLKK